MLPGVYTREECYCLTEKEGRGKCFGSLQSAMNQLTQVTKGFFEKLVKELELGLSGLTERYSNSSEVGVIKDAN